MLEGRGLNLETMRDLSRLLREPAIAAGVIGEVAVALHGHVRTTVDVDVLTYPLLEHLAKDLTGAGCEFNAGNCKFRRWGVPVPRILAERSGPVSAEPDEIDVIGVLRYHALGNDFAQHVDRDLRSGNRRFVRAIQRDRGSFDA